MNSYTSNVIIFGSEKRWPKIETLAPPVRNPHCFEEMLEGKLLSKKLKITCEGIFLNSSSAKFWSSLHT
jgi:hypothetical protein